MRQTIFFIPLVPEWALLLLGLLLCICAVFAWRRGLSGWLLRLCAAAVILGALSGPMLRQEDRKPLADILLVLEDQSASNLIADRQNQTLLGADALVQAVENMPNTEVRRIVVASAPNNGGTRLGAALAGAIAETPNARIAGVIAVTDGQIHDPEQIPSLPAPFHLILSGERADWDRRLSISNAPAFAIIDEAVTLTLRIDDDGAAPASGGIAPLDVAVDGAAPMRFEVPIGKDIDVPISLPHGGRNVIQFTVPAAMGELTDRNNTALIQMNGIRDRLRVLLVSGEPHSGGRTWRNLLKSDSSVDLVHFTILRPPGKQDGVPVEELSLIAFPTRELFLEKIDDFDLIIFDRFKRRGILPTLYLENVVNYVRRGGAVLVSAGADFAGANSIYRSPLGEILPAGPTARVLDRPYRPQITDPGMRHPVTTGLGDPQTWGRWWAQVELQAPRGTVLMSGLEGRPLLVLDRVEQGRVALLASDNAWLWSRGYDGGGPQSELLRRLAHWMMKEPELEEESLGATSVGAELRIERRSLSQELPPVTLTGPDGETRQLELSQTRPGVFEAIARDLETGLYRLENGAVSSVVGLGPAAPKEFEKTIASAKDLAPFAQNISMLEEGVPRVRQTAVGRAASGRGWIGITPRGAYDVQGLREFALVPAWLVALFALGLILGAWLWEGRR